MVARALARIRSKKIAGAARVDIRRDERRPGAGGTIAYNKVAKAKPDGYTILIAHIGMSTAPALHRKLSFNPLTDFEYIGQVNRKPPRPPGREFELD